MWQPEASTTVGDALNTPDISSIVTEITSQSDWAAGNSLAILFGHTSGSGARWVESFSLMNDVATPALVFETAANCGGCSTSQGQASVSNILDSAEEDVANGNMYLDSSDLELMNDGGQQVVFFLMPP